MVSGQNDVRVDNLPIIFVIMRQKAERVTRRITRGLGISQQEGKGFQYSDGASAECYHGGPGERFAVPPSGD